MHTSQVIAIGPTAYHTIAAGEAALVWGVTSRGAFIATEHEQILFLTAEKSRGPLTINVAEADLLTGAITRGIQVLLRPGKITFPSLEVALAIDESLIWRPLEPGSALLDAANLEERLSTLIESIRRVNPGLVMGNLVNDPTALAAALIHPAPVKAANALISLLGSGRGLTPAGDDFILGVLLALNRWKNLGWNEAARDQLNRLMVTNARKKTTAISACLIQSATLGLADERLLNAIDYLFIGEGDASVLARELLTWGASSGTDALDGMWFCIHAQDFLK